MGGVGCASMSLGTWTSIGCGLGCCSCNGGGGRLVPISVRSELCRLLYLLAVVKLLPLSIRLLPVPLVQDVPLSRTSEDETESRSA